MDTYRNGNYQGNGNGPPVFHPPFPPKTFYRIVDGQRGESPTLSTLTDRQDSLMLCQQLQERDGFDDFMDQNMDLTPYLNEVQEYLDGESGDNFEPLLDKQRLLENDIYAQQYNYANSNNEYADLTPLENRDTESPLLASMPRSPELLSMNVPIKAETVYDDDGEESIPTTSLKKVKTEQVEVSPFSPTIKPRKYMLKPEEEKKNPLYRIKREKNNDAVRKSRTKAKEQQRQKEEDIKKLQGQLQDLTAQMSVKNGRIGDLEKLVRDLEFENKEFSGENKRLKAQLTLIKKYCRCRCSS